MCPVREATRAATTPWNNQLLAGSATAGEGIFVTETGSPDVAALFDSPVEVRSSEAPYQTGLNGVPARLHFYVTSDAVLLGASHLQAAIREASDIGTYMPMAVGDHANVWLYDSGTTISQGSPLAIKQIKPFLTELNTDFISVENQTKVKMRIFCSKRTSLIQVESRVRSKPAATLVIETLMLRSLPGTAYHE